jgi:hypothetical protein
VRGQIRQKTASCLQNPKIIVPVIIAFVIDHHSLEVTTIFFTWPFPAIFWFVYKRRTFRLDVDSIRSWGNIFKDHERDNKIPMKCCRKSSRRFFSATTTHGPLYVLIPLSSYTIIHYCYRLPTYTGDRAAMKSAKATPTLYIINIVSPAKMHSELQSFCFVFNDKVQSWWSTTACRSIQ